MERRIENPAACDGKGRQVRSESAHNRTVQLKIGLPMKITWLGTLSDGTRSFEVDCNRTPWHVLLRCIRRLPNTEVKDTTFSLKAQSRATIKYKDITITIDSPWADYEISCKSDSKTFDEFAAKLQDYRMKWWEWLF